MSVCFRLQSAHDNRPLTFPEFSDRTHQRIYISATPAKYEWEHTPKAWMTEQIIRPTGLLDPLIIVKQTKGQVDDIRREIDATIDRKERSLVTTLTKRLAEDLTKFFQERQYKVRYLHSDVETLERIEILRKLRTGEIDVLVGINLLREGLDLPEVSFIAILDADKQGFLRSRDALIQITGRAARHLNGEVILYGDTITDSMKRAIDETERRRQIQADFNAEHGITPQQIQKEIRKSLLEEANARNEEELAPLIPQGPKKEVIKALEREMKRAAKEI